MKNIIFGILLLFSLENLHSSDQQFPDLDGKLSNGAQLAFDITTEALAFAVQGCYQKYLYDHSITESNWGLAYFWYSAARLTTTLLIEDELATPYINRKVFFDVLVGSLLIMSETAFTHDTSTAAYLYLLTSLSFLILLTGFECMKACVQLYSQDARNEL